MIDPTNPEHAALVAAFLAEQPEHAPYLMPVRRLAVRNAEGEWTELTPDLWAELQEAAFVLDDQRRVHDAAYAAWRKADKARNFATTAPTPSPKPPRAPGSAAWAALVGRCDYRWSYATALEKIDAMPVLGDTDQPVYLELCPHPECNKTVPLGRRYNGIARPRFSPRNWHSVTPWDTFGTCGPTHLDAIGKARIAAFRAAAAWLPNGAARLAADAARLTADVADLAAEVQRQAEELAVAQLHCRELDRLTADVSTADYL